MSSSRKCKNCGGSEIEVDPARGDAVCTACGSVLEDSIIVAEVQFEEGAHGTSSAIGQFVSADSKGGATKFGASFHVAGGLESREITLKKARTGITHLCHQLRLNQHCIDTACNFFKMAISRNLTRGRRNTHVHAACVYLTCRTECTEHLLIDISDVVQICCYELGRTYLRLSQALCINVPSIDPCLYILRFAAKLQFGSKTQQVANTALRLVQRMKRDSIHSGRRPSGLCGAALLISARLHEYNRSPGDIVKIVKVHESTIRKRLIEFGDTPSSSLTLEEFMTIDLEEEQDPPSFKAARKKDKERLQKLMEEEADSFNELQRQIELQLEKDSVKKRPSSRCSIKDEGREQIDTNNFIRESTLGAIQTIMKDVDTDESMDMEEPIKELGPDIESMGLANSLEDTSNAFQPASEVELDLNFDDIDDEEIDTYIMNDDEFKCKQELWHQRNAGFLEEQRIKAEKQQQEREEGKPEKKRKKGPRKKAVGPANSAGEAIEKILQEKKVSSKINYEVLKSLKAAPTPSDPIALDEEAASTTSESIKRRRLSSVSNYLEQTPTKGGRKKAKENAGGIGVSIEDVQKTTVPKEEMVTVKKKDDSIAMSEEEIDEDDDEEEQQVDEAANEMGVLQMLRQHREDEGDDYNDEYFEEEY